MKKKLNENDLIKWSFFFSFRFVLRRLMTLIHWNKNVDRRKALLDRIVKIRPQGKRNLW